METLTLEQAYYIGELIAAVAIITSGQDKLTRGSENERI